MKFSKNLIFRVFLIALFLIPLIFFSQFYVHFNAYLTSNVISMVITQQWHIVLFFILVFLVFLIPLSYRRKASWMEYGLVTAFFVSLFVEMYGIPLTILLASKYFFVPGTEMPPTVLSMSFLGVVLGFDLAMVYGSILILLGMGLIILGWVTLYKNSSREGLVTDGIYKYSRHPQYLGFILIILGWFFGWPTPLTIIFAPILIYKYLSVCRKEEKEISEEFPEYEKYRNTAPFMI
jgi:protein-S-isoprenylcysteine O-methyltransferase Ste14